jgi:hypothetical protein
MTRSVKKLVAVFYYTTYQFTPGSMVTGADLISGNYRKKTLGTISTHESTSGTATIVLKQDHRLALLTCAHILDSPDTLISYFAPTAEEPVPMIKSIAIKEKQQIFIKNLSGCGSFSILAIDREADLAIVGKECEESIDSLSVFGFKRGNSGELEWGSFVYILGYPLGSLMVTKGIVSDPNSDQKGSFTVDALLNKGCSGGIILAIRDGIPNFEMVGIVKSLSTRLAYYLKPEQEIHAFHYNEFIPYSGNIYVGTNESINYGINYVISSGEITAFYKKHRIALHRLGYQMDDFFL